MFAVLRQVGDEFHPHVERVSCVFIREKFEQIEYFRSIIDQCYRQCNSHTQTGFGDEHTTPGPFGIDVDCCEHAHFFCVMGKWIERKREENGGRTKVGDFLLGTVLGLGESAETVTDTADQILDDPVGYLQERSRDPKGLLVDGLNLLPGFVAPTLGMAADLLLEDPNAPKDAATNYSYSTQEDMHARAMESLFGDKKKPGIKAGDDIGTGPVTGVTDETRHLFPSFSKETKKPEETTADSPVDPAPVVPVPENDMTGDIKRDVVNVSFPLSPEDRLLLDRWRTVCRRC